MKVIDYTPGMTLKPGLYRMTAGQYHGNQFCPLPILSSSVIQAMLSGSPLHAITEYRAVDRASARRMELGSTAHRIVLAAGADFDILEFKDYKTNAAKDARDNSTAAGRTPVLRCDFEAAEQASKPMLEALQDYLGANIEDCYRELVLLWQDDKGHWRKAMIDAARKDLSRLADLKFTEASVSPQVCTRRLYDMGYHIQHAHYTGGADALDPEQAGLREMGFLFAEVQAPFAVSPPMLLSEAGKEMGRQQVAIASAKWDACVASGRWPSYSKEPYTAEPPAWALGQWNERMMGDESLNPEVDQRFANV